MAIDKAKQTQRIVIIQTMYMIEALHLEYEAGRAVSSAVRDVAKALKEMLVNGANLLSDEQVELTRVFTNPLDENVKSNFTDEDVVKDMKRLYDLSCLDNEQWLKEASNRVSLLFYDLHHIDEIISGKLSTTWRLERLAVIVKNIIRTAVAEMHSEKYDVSLRGLFLSDFMQITKHFGHINDTKFVHAILHNIFNM